MGSGKSSIASLASATWGCPFYDTDQLLGESYDSPVQEQIIIDPISFRRREAELIAQLVDLGRGVISLGGGAIENPGTRSLLRGKPVVFLDPGVDICWQRVRADTQPRPLATDYDSFVALYKKRLPLYLSVCRWHLTDNLPPEQLLVKLEKLLQQG
ncbi:MAG: shikimate kinase [Bacillota bacterium]|jgi:shikimate kinase